MNDCNRRLIVAGGIAISILTGLGIRSYLNSGDVDPTDRSTPYRAGACVTSNDINVGIHSKINFITSGPDGVVFNYTYTDGTELTTNERTMDSFKYRYNLPEDCERFNNLSQAYQTLTLKLRIQSLEERMDSMERRKK